MDRKYSAQIAYPLIAADPDDALSSALRDIILYVSPDDSLVPSGSLMTPEPAGIGEAGAWLSGHDGSIVTFYVKIPLDDDYVDNSVDIEGHNAYGYIARTFDLSTSYPGQVATIRGDDARSALVLDYLQFSGLGAPATYTTLNVVEPGRIVPCRRRVRSLSIYNEYRARDPVDRAALPPDTQEIVYFEGDTLVLNDGYNCALDYDETSKILRITGGVGLGKGQPDSNEWDDDPGPVERGIRSINGVNQNGIVEIQNGPSVLVIGTEGDLEIRLRDQGDEE